MNTTPAVINIHITSLGTEKHQKWRFILQESKNIFSYFAHLYFKKFTHQI